MSKCLCPGHKHLLCPSMTRQWAPYIKLILKILLFFLVNTKNISCLRFVNYETFLQQFLSVLEGNFCWILMQGHCPESIHIMNLQKGSCSVIEGEGQTPINHQRSIKAARLYAYWPSKSPRLDAFTSHGWRDQLISYSVHHTWLLCRIGKCVSGKAETRNSE